MRSISRFAAGQAEVLAVTLELSCATEPAHARDLSKASFSLMTHWRPLYFHQLVARCAWRLSNVESITADVHFKGKLAAVPGCAPGSVAAFSRRRFGRGGIGENGTISRNRHWTGRPPRACSRNANHAERTHTARQARLASHIRFKSSALPNTTTDAEGCWPCLPVLRRRVLLHRCSFPCRHT